MMLLPVPIKIWAQWHDDPSREREHAGLLERVFGAKLVLRSPGAIGRFVLVTLDDNLSTRVFAAPQVEWYAKVHA